MSIASNGPGVVLESVKIVEFPPTDLEDDTSAFISHLRHIPLGEMSLDAKHFWGMHNSPRLRGKFIESPDNKKGREESMHHVRFGQLLLESTTDQELPTRIAIKPHNGLRKTEYEPAITATEMLAHEWAANEYVSGLSNYERAYVPLGVWKRRDRKPRLITLFDEQTQTFDNIFWAEGDSAKSTGRGRVEKALHLSLFAIGVLHGAGLVHQDPQVKNLARDSQQVRFVDLESLSKLPTDSDGVIADDLETQRFVRADMHIFAESALLRYGKPTAMHDKVASVVSNDKIIHAATRNYWRGVAQGELRNGTAMPDSLIIQPEQLSDIFKFIMSHEEELSKQGA